MHQAIQLAPIGFIANARDNLTYLNIDDDYIHALFPFLANKQVCLPDYFSKDLIGAHISVIYPEENTTIIQSDLGQIHYFTIKEIYTTELDLKQYYLLLIESPCLVAFRKKYDLASKPCFKNHVIEFHITIEVSS